MPLVTRVEQREARAKKAAPLEEDEVSSPEKKKKKKKTKGAAKAKAKARAKAKAKAKGKKAEKIKCGAGNRGRGRGRGRGSQKRPASAIQEVDSSQSGVEESKPEVMPVPAVGDSQSCVEAEDRPAPAVEPPQSGVEGDTPRVRKKPAAKPYKKPAKAAPGTKKKVKKAEGRSTFAGRRCPDNDPAKMRFQCMQRAFNRYIGPRIHSPSQCEAELFAECFSQPHLATLPRR